MRGAFESAWTGYLKEYKELEDERLTLQKSVADAQDSLKKLKDNIATSEEIVRALTDSTTHDKTDLDKVAQDLSTLNTALADFKNRPTTQLASIINQLNDDGKAIVPKLDQIFAELRKQYTYNVITVSSALSDISSKYLDAITIPSETFNDAFGTSSRLVSNRIATSNSVHLPAGSEVVAYWGIAKGGITTVGGGLTTQEFRLN
jgi:uncharacterized phage infection (PIP) family protein YhgE